MKKLLFVAFVIPVVLMATTACQMQGDYEMIEGILQNVDEINGEMTVVTKDGETITIKITKDTPIDTENGSADVNKVEVGSTIKLETSTRNIVDRKIDVLKASDVEPTLSASVDVSNILPSLESFEDVFKALGVWEKAVALHERGLTWAHVARELGYGEDSMHIHLREIAKEHLERAVNAGLITKDQFERQYQHFDELAIKWIREIFSDVELRPTTSDAVVE